MTRNQEAKTILAPEWREFGRMAAELGMNQYQLADMMVKALVNEGRTGHVAANQLYRSIKELRCNGDSFVEFLFCNYGTPNHVICLHDRIQDGLEDLKINPDDAQTGARANLTEDALELREYFREYRAEYEDGSDKTLADGMRGVLAWRKRKLEQMQNNDKLRHW